MKKIILCFGIIGIACIAFLYMGWNQTESFGKGDVNQIPETLISPEKLSKLATEYPIHNAIHKKMNMDCTSCHGDFESIEEIEPVTNEKCESCHGDYERVAERTSFLDEEQVNPHNNFHYDMKLDCISCHKGHQESTNFCGNCHNAELWMNETP